MNTHVVKYENMSGNDQQGQISSISVQRRGEYVLGDFSITYELDFTCNVLFLKLSSKNI